MLKLPHNVIQLIVYWSRSCPMGIHYYCKGDYPFKQHRPRSFKIHSVPNGDQRWRQSLCSKNTSTQKCILVGCVPPTAVAMGGSASVHAGIQPPQVQACRDPPPRCGPGDTPDQTPQLPLWVWAWKPARHARIPPPPRPAARHVGIPPPRGQTRVKT